MPPRTSEFSASAQIEQERVAKFVRLRVVAAIAAATAMVGLVIAEAVTRQVLEDVAQRLLSDFSDRARR